jgi:hypothetical protein
MAGTNFEKRWSLGEPLPCDLRSIDCVINLASATLVSALDGASAAALDFSGTELILNQRDQSGQRSISHLVSRPVGVGSGRAPRDIDEIQPIAHQLGNCTRLFGRQFTDMLSGYKLFSRRFVKSFPALSTGFEIETETDHPCAGTQHAGLRADFCNKIGPKLQRLSPRRTSAFRGKTALISSYAAI